MEYLFKASAVIFIFYLLYKLFLQRETFFHTNRVYLLIGIITSICIPFIIIPIYIEYIPIPLTNSTTFITEPEVQQNATETIFDWRQLAFILYIIGLILCLGKVLMEFTSLRFLLNRHSYYKSDSFILVETNEDIQAFSFFNWIIYNPSIYSQDELQHILNHEKVHAKEFHSIDIILTQLACVILWFNPFVWLYKKEIQQNLEFIADKKAQNFSKCEKSYQLILLKSSGIEKDKFLITNNFYNSQIKKRIIMLHKSKSSKVNAWKYGLILPALALFLMSFNTKEIFIEAEGLDNNSSSTQTEVLTQLNNFYDDIDFDKKTKIKSEEKTETKKSNKKKSNNLIAQTQPKVNKNTLNTIRDISITVINKNTTDSELDEIKEDFKKEGITVKFKGIKRNGKGEITTIKIEAKSKTSNVSYNVNSDKAIDEVKIVFDEDNNSISIGNSNTRHVKNTYVYDMHEGDDEHKIHKSVSSSHVFVTSDDEHEHEHDDYDDHDQNSKIIVISNGKKGKVKTIKRSKNIEVISGDDSKVEIIVDDEGNNDEEIIIVNGKKINMNKDQDNVIVRRKSKKVWISDDNGNEDVIVLQNVDNNSNVFISNSDGKDPLFILDGKEISKEKFTKINPDDIESVTVLKNKNAMELYGKKGKDGVIIVKTKKN